MVTAATERKTQGLVAVPAMKTLSCRDVCSRRFFFLFDTGDTAVAADGNPGGSRANHDVGLSFRVALTRD